MWQQAYETGARSGLLGDGLEICAHTHMPFVSWICGRRWCERASGRAGGGAQLSRHTIGEAL